MRMQKLIIRGFLAAAVAWLPAMSSAAIHGRRAAGTIAVQTHPSDFSREASGLLASLRDDSAAVARHAASLKGFAADLNISSHAHESELQQIKETINRMNGKLSRLEAIRGSVEPWQLKAIDSAAPALRLMVNNTGDALRLLKSDTSHTWLPTYRKYVGNIYSGF